MKKCRSSILGITVVATALMVPLAEAQDATIDTELLDLLEVVSQGGSVSTEEGSNAVVEVDGQDAIVESETNILGQVVVESALENDPVLAPVEDTNAVDVVVDEVVGPMPIADLVSSETNAVEVLPVEPAEEMIVDPVVVVEEVVETNSGAVVEEVNSVDVSAAEVVDEVVAVAEVDEPAIGDDIVPDLVDELIADAETDVDLLPEDYAVEPVDAVDAVDMDLVGEEAATAMDNLISVRLNKVGLEEAINLFAQLSGANIIVPELTDAAQISVNLKDVEWRPALQSILDSYDYELYQRVSGSNVYSVRRRPEGAPEPQVVETFKLNYATVPNAAALIRQLLPADAKVSEFASRNMIVVKSSESRLSEVRAVLTSIDTVRQQVYIESKFMELSDGAQKDIGIDWQVLKGYGVSARSLSSAMSHTDEDNTTTLERFRANGDRLELAEAPEVIEGLSEPFYTYFPTTEKTTSDLLSKVSTAVFDADTFSLMLSALQSSRGVNIVSNPKIIVANEELANISIVTKEPNLKQSRTESLNDTGDNITFELDKTNPWFEYGVKLDVVPSINTSSNITIKITPSLTRKEADKPAGDNTYPVISEKSIETVFNLTSGQTAAIGGLTEVSESDIERKVPLLGSIPLLGRLFSWEQTVSGQNETIIFVTVGLANTQEIVTETGLPADSELARRRVIVERNKEAVRSQGRTYFTTQQDEQREDELALMRLKEARRIEMRERALQQKLERSLRNAE